MLSLANIRQRDCNRKASTHGRNTMPCGPGRAAQRPNRQSHWVNPQLSRFSNTRITRSTKLADMSVKPIPEGYTSLTPFLCIDDASAAIDFYVSVFGAKLVDRMDGPGGTVAHAELDFGNGRLQLGDPAEAYQIAAPDPKAPATHSVAFYCEDVDAVVAKAEQAGATIREPAQTFVTGDRFASVLDPFGQRWTVMTRVEDVSPEERDRRMAEWAKENVGS
jgi:PhnB protein